MSILIFLIGLILITVGTYQLKYYREARRWRTSNLKDVEFELKESRKVDGNYVWDMYIPQAKYEYEVSNEEYIGHTISKDKMHLQFLHKQEAKEFIARLNKQPCAYVNPKDPEDAVLIKSISKKRKSHIAALILSGGLLIISSFILEFLIA